MLQDLKRFVVYATTDGETDDIVWQRRYMMAAGVYFAAALVFVFFILFHLVRGEWVILFFDGLFLVSALAAMWLLYKKRLLDVPLWFCSALVGSFVLWLVWTDQNASFSIGWTFLFPVFWIPLLGLRIGGVAGIAFICVVNFMSWICIGDWNHGNWDVLSAVRMTLLSGFFYMLAMLIEMSWLRTARRLQILRAREKMVSQNLRRRAVTDALTGLNNRRYFDERLDEELARVRRTKSVSGLLLLDIDHFKSINDQYGHLEGDKVLIRVGEVLRRYLRESDVVARWGGEEFAILLPDSDQEHTREVGEKLRRAVERTGFDIGKTVTLSVGVGIIQSDKQDKDHVLGAADQSLYRAKERGRNRIGELVPQM